MIKKILWGFIAIFLILLGCVMFYFLPIWALPILPANYAESVVDRTVAKFIDNRDFPDKLLDVLNQNPRIITPNMYASIARMYVMAQDGQIGRMRSLILNVNDEELFCYSISDLELSDKMIPTDYSGQTIAAAIGESWRCKIYEEVK